MPEDLIPALELTSAGDGRTDAVIPRRHAWPVRVLCVDDNRDAADSEAELLRVVGFDPRACYDGRSALCLAREWAPDVCLIDLHMPDMDGDELAGRLRAEAAGRPVLMVAVTAMSSDESVARTGAAGFTLHLVKPVDPGILVGMMERFRRLLAPSIPAADVTPTAGRDGDGWGRGPKSSQFGMWLARSE